MIAHGRPSFGVSGDADGFTARRFPDPGTITTRERPHAGSRFHARGDTGATIAACAVAIPLAFNRPPERPTIVRVFGVSGP